MARPLNKKWFGVATNPGYQIVVNGIKWVDGTTSTNGYIVKQKGFNSYIVSNGVKQELCVLANAISTAALTNGQCYITAIPFGGSALPCYKIQQNRLSVFNIDGSIVSYSWGPTDATSADQATLIDTAIDIRTATGTVSLVSGEVDSVVVTDAGDGYAARPTVTITGDGTGATATATLSNGSVSGVTIVNAGSGYTTASVTFSAAP